MALLAPLAYLAAAWTFSRAKPAVSLAQQVEASETRNAPIPLFLFLGLMIGLQAFSEGTVRSFFNVYLDTDLSLPTGLIGGIMGASQLLLILLSLIIPAVLTRWGTKGSLTIFTIALAFFILALAWVPTRFGASLAYDDFCCIDRWVSAGLGFRRLVGWFFREGRRLSGPVPPRCSVRTAVCRASVGARPLQSRSCVEREPYDG